MPFPQQEVLERYQKLPQELRDAIFAEANADKVFDIGKRHTLTINKVGGLATQIGYVMLGLTKPKDFVDQLASALEVDKKSAQAIADDVNHEIFYPVREHLRMLHNAPNEFPEPKPDTPASIFAEKMAGVSREPVKEIHVTEKPKDSFAELRAELQREIETERGGETGESQPEKSGGDLRKSHFLGEERLPGEKMSDVHLDVGRPSPRPAVPPAYITEQRPSKPFALDEKESSLPTPPRVPDASNGAGGTPTSPPVGVGAAPLPAKQLENGAGKSRFPMEERLPETKKPPVSSPATLPNNTGLLPAFRGYKMTGQPMQTVKPIESDTGESHSPLEERLPGIPASHTEVELPGTTKSPQLEQPALKNQPQTQPHGQQKQNYSDPYKEPII